MKSLVTKMMNNVKTKMEETKEKLKNEEIEVKSKDKSIKIIINGNQEIKSLKINKTDIKEIEKLEQTLLETINKAITKSNEKAKANMSKITGGLKVPSMLKDLF